MVGRVKFEVFGKHGWAVAYAKPETVEANRLLFLAYGCRVRINGDEYAVSKAA